MNVSEDLEGMAVARYWLLLWADCLKARQGREADLYVPGSPGGKEYRPLDDPKPMLFVFLQVEHCLGSSDGVDWNLAKHVWFHRRPADEFRHPELPVEGRTKLFQRRQRIIKKLAWQIRLKAPEAICEETLKNARDRLMESRRRSQKAA